jgi:hypothetical protein
MNKLKTTIVAIAIAIFGAEVNAQTNQTKIDPQAYVDALSNFYLADLCADTVLFTQVGKRNDSYDVSKKDISKFIKSKYKDKQTRFEWQSSGNSGRAIVISQYVKNSRIPIRFFVMFLSYTDNRIVVIEVEENK